MTWRSRIVIIACLLGANVAAAQTFVWAKPKGDVNAPAAFTFTYRSRQCVIANDGRGRCDGSQFRIRLPIDDGTIENLAVAEIGNDLVMAYSLTDEEVAWGHIVRVTGDRGRIRWRRRIGGLNLALPLIARDSVYVAALAYIARLRLSDGAFVWRLEREYPGGGYESPALALSGKQVVITWRDLSTDRQKVECVAADSGKSEACR